MLFIAGSIMIISMMFYQISSIIMRKLENETQILEISGNFVEFEMIKCQDVEMDQENKFSY